MHHILYIQEGEALDTLAHHRPRDTRHHTTLKPDFSCPSQLHARRLGTSKHCRYSSPRIDFESSLDYRRSLSRNLGPVIARAKACDTSVRWTPANTIGHGVYKTGYTINKKTTSFEQRRAETGSKHETENKEWEDMQDCTREALPSPQTRTFDHKCSSANITL